MDTLTQVLELFSRFAVIGGGLWLAWGAIVAGGALKDHNGPQIQTGVWQIVGGGTRHRRRALPTDRALSVRRASSWKTPP